MNGAALGIAHAGLADGDVRRLRAMLLLALAEGTLKGHWHVSEAGSAHLLVTSALAAGEVVRRLPSSRIRLVAVLGGERDIAPPGTVKLARPISVEALLELLKLAENRVMGQVSAPATADEHRLVQLAGLIRSQGGPAEPGVLLVSGLGRGPIWIVPERRQFYCSESLFAVHNFDLRSQITVQRVPLDALPADRIQPKPLLMLQWAVGLLIGPLGLLPWLSPDATFRLRTFPEFQALHHEPVHRRLAAAFSRPVAGLSAASELAQISRADVAGFLNAAELCGYLHTSASGKAVRARGSSRERGTLVKIFRRALGIGKTDV